MSPAGGLLWISLALGAAAPSPAVRVDRSAWLGADFHALCPAELAVFGAGGAGSTAVVTGVYPHSAADTAQLAPGDVITAVDGQPVRSPEDLDHLLQIHFG